MMSSRKRNSSTLDEAAGKVLKNAKLDENNQSHQLSPAIEGASSQHSSSSQLSQTLAQPADKLLIPILQSMMNQMRQMNDTLQIIAHQTAATAVSNKPIRYH